MSTPAGQLIGGAGPVGKQLHAALLFFVSILRHQRVLRNELQCHKDENEGAHIIQERLVGGVQGAGKHGLLPH